MVELTNLQHAVMQQAAVAGYVSHLHALIFVVHDTAALSYPAADARARRVLYRLEALGLLRGYVKARGIVVYAVTTKGARYLRDNGVENVRVTLTITAQAEHVMHRIVADALTLLLSIKHAAINHSSLTERQVLTGSAATFKSDFRKLPDGLVINSADRHFIAVEVDTTKRNRLHRDALINALKAMNDVVPGSAVAERNNPACVLWVVPHKGAGAYQAAERALLNRGFQKREHVAEQGVFFGKAVVVVLARFNFRAKTSTWLEQVTAIAMHPYVELP